MVLFVPLIPQELRVEVHLEECVTYHPLNVMRFSLYSQISLFLRNNLLCSLLLRGNMNENDTVLLILGSAAGGILLGWIFFGRERSFTVLRDDSGRIEEIVEK